MQSPLIAVRANMSAYCVCCFSADRQDWARAVAVGDSEGSAQRLPCCATHFLVNLSLSNALLESGGNTMALK